MIHAYRKIQLFFFFSKKLFLLAGVPRWAGSDPSKNRNGNSVNFRSLTGARGRGGTVPPNAKDGKFNSRHGGYYENSASGARGGKGVSMCELVRRQFSGTSSMMSFDGGYDSSCSQDAGVGGASSEKR